MSNVGRGPREGFCWSVLQDRPLTIVSPAVSHVKWLSCSLADVWRFSRRGPRGRNIDERTPGFRELTWDRHVPALHNQDQHHP